MYPKRINTTEKTSVHSAIILSLNLYKEKKEKIPGRSCHKRFASLLSPGINDTIPTQVNVGKFRNFQQKYTRLLNLKLSLRIYVRLHFNAGRCTVDLFLEVETDI